MIRTLLAGPLALACAAPTAAATMPATCATFAATLARATGGDTIELRGECGLVKVAKAFPDDAPLTIDATGAVLSLEATSKARNVVLRGGTLRATGGPTGGAMAGYGALVRGARVTFDGVGVTASKKGIVTDKASAVSVLNSRFYELGDDGIIANLTAGLVVRGNTFVDFRPTPTTCTTPTAVVRGLSSRACTAQGGTWRDGSHPDAVQMRNAVTDATIADNVVFADIQGFAQMDSKGDLPLQRIYIARNRVTAGGHHITLGGNCVDCRIEGNTVGRYRADGYKAVIRPGSARRCGNVVQDEKPDAGC